MPSHSKKQHNFMEAIAHSPSFAKKAGVAQSVGKDFAAADKGKTFSKGSEMKESKGMVGKEVAFFKKKGAPKSMIKHEETEMMKKGGRVRRMADGGLGSSMGEGTPNFAVSSIESDEGYRKEKDQGAKNLRSIKNFLGFGDSSDEGERKPTVEQRKTVTPAAAKPSWAGSGDSDSAKKTYPLPRNRTLPDIKNPESDDNERKFRGPQFANSVSDRGEGELSGDGLSPAKGYKAPSKPVAPRSKPIGVEKTVKQERVITEPVDTSRAAIEERRAAERKTTETKPKSPSRFGLASDETRESVRRGLGRFADIFNLSKRHEQEFGKKAAKGGQVKRMRYGGSPDDGMDMGQPMRGAPMNAGRGMPMQAMGPEMVPRSPIEPPPKQPKLLPGEKPEKSFDSINRANGIMNGPQRNGPSMQPYPDGPSRGIKAGGQVKKMAEGGFTREADGIAKKGKTQGKVVKMAGGGFVRSADGCAQRGKTKGAQVKMSRGGKC
jgi:hypothetical protein